MTKNETAVFGAGCFWCSEAAFKLLPGVISVIPGYAGGHIADPSYELVSTGTTGHAEVVRVEYDSKQTSYKQLLDWFWKIHDPTTPNRQGNDVGPQYRSIILWVNKNQEQAATRSKEEQSAIFLQPIVTQIEPLEKFYEAEDYHHDYFAKHPDAAYCRVIIAPKVEKLKKIMNQE